MKVLTALPPLKILTAPVDSEIATAIRAAITYSSRVQAIGELVYQTGFFGDFQDAQSLLLIYLPSHSQVDIIVCIETQEKTQFERLVTACFQQALLFGSEAIGHRDTILHHDEFTDIFVWSDGTRYVDRGLYRQGA